MRPIRSIFVLLLSFSSLMGCVSPKTFVDPSVPKVSYEDIERRAEPLRLTLAVEFQRNGQPFPKVDSQLKDKAERLLRATGLIVPTDEQPVGDIKIIVNNIGDIGAAAATGFGTGLTFGLVGSTVMDSYEMTISITVNGKTVTRTAIRHALYTAIGNATLPPGVEIVPTNVAFDRVIEQMLLRGLHDMQKADELVVSRYSELRRL
jgi:hypothetical protein